MIEGKNVLVAGLARTGLAVVEFLQHFNCRTSVSEAKPAESFPNITQRFPEVEFEFGGHQPETFLKADLIVLSPGIPDTIPPLVEARRRGISIISEIELASRHLKGTMIGITGTNGKSTTTELTATMLREGGKSAYACGNLGPPVISHCLDSKPADYYVIELSSFQLETITGFRPHIAAVLNLAEDHLDRYPDLERYFQAKMRIFENQKESDFAILNYDDPYLRERTASLKSSRFWFSRSEIPPSGVYAHEGIIKVIAGWPVVNFTLAKLRGVHNLENTLCASSIALLCGVRNKDMQRALEQFQGLRHRMELIAEVKGVGYYDDSKATNVDSVVKSLQSFPGNILLILGGKDKGCDYRLLRDLVRERVKALLLIGEATQRIKKELGDVKAPKICATLEQAVQTAHDLAASGDVVLLSPACSSFDMFRDYEHRAEVFRAAVKGLSTDEHR
jgi:UDP-N-acetylmuramoylalanine--D-glutamate ligase